MELYRPANGETGIRHILKRAVAEKAGDVHIEPETDYVRVRFRIDGRLKEIFRLPKETAQSLSVRIKVLGGMNVGETRIPQDGSFSRTDGGETRDFRISVMPTVKGLSLIHI